MLENYLVCNVSACPSLTLPFQANQPPLLLMILISHRFLKSITTTQMYSAKARPTLLLHIAFMTSKSTLKTEPLFRLVRCILFLSLNWEPFENSLTSTSTLDSFDLLNPLTVHQSSSFARKMVLSDFASISGD